ncbi:hypothetical protein DUI87_26483 [Hirundo rustica rustica]|uniref:ribonuclease H n=1 Tax=Hirundo rustica rustica TaxID=333673 RepID=A0A3M0JQE3_HIRRU|nr:hypothetical protein DUI87_26483 [Hirundo rustica rustica]
MEIDCGLPCLERSDSTIERCCAGELELQYELESKAAKWYATIDIANAFFSIPLAAECRPQFAFTWRGVQYTWNRLPQGWKHSPTICHGLIQAALEKGEAPEHLQYIDDIIVWGNTAMEVFEKGEKIIQILLKAGFPVKKSKVKGPAREIQFLGVKWHDGRRQIPTEVINKITAMCPPTNKRETQAFLGAIGFWRLHIPEYSQIVSPLYLVTRKKNHFHWGPEEQQAFAQIKQEIAHAVALGPVRTGPEVKNMLYSVAGNNGLSWSLWQKGPGETRGRPLGFWSRSYRGSKANYTPTEKEILAAYEGVQAASEVVGTETQLLLAPQLPVLGWMFKAEVPSTHHATNATWSKWIALITQRAHIGNPNRPGILEIITNWPEGEKFGLMDEEEQEQVTRTKEAPPYNQLPAEETRYALFTDSSCRIVGMNRKWKAAVWSPTRQVAQATEGEGGSSPLAEFKSVQLALDIAEREKWPKLYLYTDSWMVANALWGWLEKWKKANWQRRGKPIWAADEWKDIATRVEKLPVKVRHVDAHVPESRANEEHQNNEQVIHDCETCAAIKQAKRVKPLWYGGRWSKYKYGEAWQIDYITLPQTRQGKRYVLTMAKATTRWLETYPVPHSTARNTILGLKKQVLWRHGTPERIESDNRTHFKNSLINNGAKEHGIEWVYHTPYHAPASGKGEKYNGLLKTTLKALGGGSFRNWEQHLAKATWLVNTRGSTNRAGPAQSESLHTVDGGKVPVVHVRGLHGQSEEMSNSSSVSHFLLLALADTWQLQLLHFCLFLGISLAALLGNGLIISTVACGHLLHTPMFFFLLNLALTDLGSICTAVPKAMHNSLWDTRNISYKGCAAQVFFFLFFISAEYSFLTIMSYDRYMSICKPLHYGTLLGSRACAHMAAAAWASAFLNALMQTANTFSLPLCHGNVLGQFFCEIPHILKLSCSKSYLRELGLTAVTASLSFGCFMFIVFSYVQIFRAMLRIPSEHGRHKAFSICLPHLAVVSLFISTDMLAYLKPPSISSPSLDLALSVLYSVVPPTLNPLIYSLRNQELKAAVWRLMVSETLN